MSEILKMMQKRDEAWNAAKAFVEQRKDKDGLLKEEDRKTYDEMEAKVQEYTREIERLQKQEALDKELEKPINKPLTNQPQNQNEKPKNFRATNEYRDAMMDAVRCKFRQISNVLREGTKEDGGYLVPDEMERQILDVLHDNNIMRQLATQITTSGEHKINVAATKPAAAWMEEGGELTFSDATFSQIMLDAYKLGVGIKVTEELLYDNVFDLESYIITEMGKALANAEEDAFLNGTGGTQPTGVFAETGGGTVEATLTAALTSDDLITLVYALKRPYRKNASFIMNDKTIAQLRKLKYGGSQEYIWQPSYQTGEPDRLLGYPVYTSEYAPEDAIAFGDFSYYKIGDRGTRTMQELNEVYATSGMVGFMAKERVDGKVVLPEAIQILKLKTAASSGSSTVSS